MKNKFAFVVFAVCEYSGCGKKVFPKIFFSVFSAIALNFKAKLYRHIE